MINIDTIVTNSITIISEIIISVTFKTEKNRISYEFHLLSLQIKHQLRGLLFLPWEIIHHHPMILRVRNGGVRKGKGEREEI